MKYFKKGVCRSLILVSSLLIIISPRLIAAVIVPVLINEIPTSTFSPFSTDPAGIVYYPSTKREVKDFFLISDSEVNEQPFFQYINVFKVDRNGNLLDTFSTDPFSDEPTGITFNPNNNHCFISDDEGTREIFEVDPGRDGICLTDDDTVTSFNTFSSFGSYDPEDVTYGKGSLFILDGLGKRVYVTEPGYDGLFNKVVGSFDTLGLNIRDPEGIVFDASNDSLYIVGGLRGLIIHTTAYGVLLDTLDISEAFPDNPAGLALAPTSNDLKRTSLYLVARGRDNDDQPGNIDGMMYELQLPATTRRNKVPDVVAGDAQSLILPDNAQLNGTINDAIVPDIITATWSKVSGPGEVSFTDEHALDCSASFTTVGDYVLRLTGYDGELYDFADILITVESLPVLTLLGQNPIILNLGDTFKDPGATALDDTDGDITGDIAITSDVNTAVADTYSVIYTVSDSAGNMASVSRSVIVRENTIAPVITLIGTNPIYLTRGENFTDPGAKALDDLYGDITASIQSSSDVNTAIAATYLVIYTVADSDGNTASTTRSVIVENNTVAPVITLIGANPLALTVDDVVTFNNDPSALGAMVMAEDDLDGDLIDKIEITSNLQAVAGTYEVRYNVTDSDGNDADEVIREVIVSDETDSSSSSGGSSNRTLLLFLALLLLMRHYRKGNLL